MRRWWGGLVIAAGLLGACATAPEERDCCAAPTARRLPAWRSWSAAAFEAAGAEDKLVVLHLGASWCHWCHVMEEETWSDPAVRALVESRFIGVHEDQAARPDLGLRYEEYGWPATIVLDAQGRELAMERGFMTPERLLRLLRTLDATRAPVKAEAPGEAEAAVSGGHRLGEAQRAALERALVEGYDVEQGSWGRPKKLMRPACVEASERAALEEGDEAALQRATFTLDQQLKLIDPVWGGVYQYSTHSGWERPHFEKLAEVQASSLRAYSRALGLARARGDRERAARYEGAVRAIAGYIEGFLTAPEGGFYASQDADLVPGEHAAAYFALGDGERRALGVPRVERRRFGREAGWLIGALAEAYGATGEPSYRAQAVAGARWALAERGLEGGGFRHDAADEAGPWLGDTLAMMDALVRLYEVTGEGEWLVAAQAAGRFIGATFLAADGEGLLSAAMPGVLGPASPAPLRHEEENQRAARTFKRLHDFTGDGAMLGLAQAAGRWAARSPGGSVCVGEALLVDRELDAAPLHITVVGRKDDPKARALFMRALQVPTEARRVEWAAPEGAPLPNPDVELPRLEEAAAFLCAGGACSSPLTTPEALLGALRYSLPGLFAPEL